MTIYYSANAWSGNAVPGPGVFRILYICIANQCRSAMAERLTQYELDLRLAYGSSLWEVTSAGTDAIPGRAMHRLAKKTLTNLGADPDEFQARRLSPDLVEEADLILGATLAERDFVVAQVPTALPRVFTIRELARLAGAMPLSTPIAAENPAVRARMLIREAHRMRGRVPYVEPSVDDIVDPPRTATAFARCASTIRTAVRSILDVLVEPSLNAAEGTEGEAGGEPEGQLALLLR